MVVDPVCKMTLEPAAAAASADWQGTRLYFCSDACRHRFLANPQSYGPTTSWTQAGGDDHACTVASGHALARWDAAAFGVAAASGVLGAMLLLGFYFGALTRVSGWSFTVRQFSEFWLYIVALATGFGIQVGLLAYLRRAMRAAASGKVIAATGTTSGAAMVACCSHYFVNLLPALGATGLVSFVGAYQVQLFWLGLVANVLGIAYVGRPLLSAFSSGGRAMRHRSWHWVLVAIVFALPLATSAQNTPLQAKENNEGNVMVTVTPLSLSTTADAWRFEVRLNTHVAPLTEDLAAASVLSDGKGHDERPSAWQGDPPGGHHRKGILIFKPISPSAESVTLKIRQVGAVPERTFTWKVPRP